jgi:hypothetical protein
MRKKIKIIDLLCLISNGEELPKKIKYINTIYEFNNNTKQYYIEDMNSHYTNSLYYQLFDNSRLNDEVEIIDNIIWKVIYNFPNYEISTNGNIRTKEYCDSRGHIRQSKQLKKQINNVGYEYVILSNDIEKHKTLTVHRLVARTFIPNPENKEEVNHIDGNKLNNCVDNLEWVTTSENMLHAYKTGIRENNYKPVKQMDIKGNLIAIYPNSCIAEKGTGICRTSIGSCCRKEKGHLSAGGYLWKFDDEEDKDIPLIPDDELFTAEENILTIQEIDYNFKVLQEKINQVVEEFNKYRKEANKDE